MRRRALVISASVATLGLVLVGATPALAAELPATDVLHPLTEEAFYSATSTGASTYISDLPAQDDGKYGADFDVATGLGYFFADDAAGCDLYSIDPMTGASTLIGPITAVGVNECDALNVALDGTLRVADQDGVILTVDKATAAVLSSVTAVGIVDISFIEQASTGQFYAGTYNGEFYTLDVTTGVATLIGLPLPYFETASFDSADTLWFSTDGEDCQGLGSLSLADPEGSVTFQGDFLDGDECLDVYAMFITQPGPAPAPAPVPAPELAATGTAPASGALPIAVLVLLAGAAAFAFGRRTQRA